MNYYNTHLIKTSDGKLITKNKLKSNYITF